MALRACANAADVRLERKLRYVYAHITQTTLPDTSCDRGDDASAEVFPRGTKCSSAF